MNSEQCASQHYGLWMADAEWLQTQVAAYRAGLLQPVDLLEPTAETYMAGQVKQVYAAGDDPKRVPPLYAVDESGIAYIDVSGQITKGRSSFGGTSNVRTRQALRAAELDSKVRGIMQMIDSPGGTVAGHKAMADEASRIARSGRKPIATHAEDIMGSAALWLGVQAQQVTASAMTSIGSIGVVTSVVDSSGAADRAGIKVHVISTGPYKGAGTPGAEVTEEQLAYLQKRVDEYNGFFMDAIRSGRKLPIAKVRELATGETWLAAEAKAHGLIDEVMTQDDAVKAFRRMLDESDAESRSRAEARSRSIRAARLND